MTLLGKRYLSNLSDLLKSQAELHFHCCRLRVCVCAHECVLGPEGRGGMKELFEINSCYLYFVTLYVFFRVYLFIQF